MRTAAVLVLLGLLPSACATAPGAATPPLVSVVGIGRTLVRPDTALVHLGAEARAPRIGDAVAEVDRRLRAVLARVKTLGVTDADVRTVEYAVEPVAEVRRPGDDAPRITGYRAVNVVQLRARDIDALARLLDAAVDAGANVVRSVHWTLADRTAAEAEARAQAGRDATARARQLAEAAGARLGRIVSLSESVRGPSPMPRGGVAALAAPGPVEAGQLEVVVTVEAQYRLEP